MRFRLRVSASIASSALAIAVGVATAAAEQATPERAAPRITNGIRTLDRPTTGALLVANGSNFAQICSGTLIGCQTFLTAAHCVCQGSTFATCGTPSASAHAVYLQNAGILAVASIDVDPTYEFAVGGDVAVLTLATPVTGVSPTPINTVGTPGTGTSADVAGYGITSGASADNGVLREGVVEIEGCGGEVPESTHVCWAFESPLDAPGVDSNTCNGDSGGPLFVDFSGTEFVAGVTSGGVSTNCLPADVSFDTDVFVHRAFIQGIGGSDLSSTTCGSISQVGAPGTTETSIDFGFFIRSEVTCRKEIAKQYSRYVAQRLVLEQRCLDGVGAGERPGPCPDAETTERVALLEAKIDAGRIATRCPEHVIGHIGAQGACAGAADAADIAACILGAGASAVAEMLDVEYADAQPSGPIGDQAQQACQEGIASAMATYTKSSLKVLTKCQAQRGQQKTPSCPDAKALELLVKAEDKAAGEIASACDDATVAELDLQGGFGGTCAGVTDASTLVGCQLNEHQAIINELVALLEDPVMPATMTVDVPPGTALLRVTLNGRQVSLNDLDIYLKLGSAPTTSSFDFASFNGGMFEEIEVASPTAGTWHVLVDRFSGNLTIPYQLTATTFEP
ncbi:MAG TPA: trypsin-like serine protease [Candidatus Limnocylindrales bacterium]|nr:trypsin-like serine protease [Candidatus Limnocylindrales bacterium]